MQFRLILEYDGGAYAGWQIQPQARTVQATLEAAVARLLGHPTRIAAAGRTDAGVHAAGQVACFHTPNRLAEDVVLRALNALTPPDLTIREVCVVDEDFDPRRSARSRSYAYRVWNRQTPSPFWQRYAWHIRHPLAADAMAEAAVVLLGEHDFTSFQAAGCDASHAVRRVIRSDVTRSGDVIVYEIEATAFLRHMVRNIVGTLVDVGRGERDPGAMTTLLAARDRNLAGRTAPAHGLCLMEVKY